MFDFSGRVAAVTGATGNLGGAVARALLRAGANLIVPDRGRGRVPDALGEGWDPARAFALDGVDATDPAAIEAAIHGGLDRYGRVDVLVNTVGGYRGGTSLVETPLDSWDFLMDLNARSMLVPCRAVIPHMRAAGRGKIVSVSARAGLSGPARLGMYSAAKSAVIRLTEALAAEVKGHGINVNCVLPGTIDTPENREAIPKSDPARWVPPVAVADVILFLASDAARAIHGAAVPVYGRG